MTKERKWSLLTDELCTLHGDIIRDWNTLINDKSTNERSCLKFINEHAALFFNRQSQTPITISELSLGSDYRIDFTTVEEGFSSGTSYTLIEIESPNAPMFTKSGKTSARLSGAIDQVLEWRRWISQHRSQAMKIFPSSRWHLGGQPTFKNLIVIGRRSESIQVQDKIWSKIHDQNINIVSFDRLSSMLQTRYFTDYYYASLSSEGKNYATMENSKNLNLAACPYRTAIPDSIWRKTISQNPHLFDFHIIVPYLEKLVSKAPLNESRLKLFDHMVEQKGL